MPIAKKTLRDGFVVVATKGSYVSNAVVDKYGWHDDVEPGQDPVTDDADTTDVYAPKGEPQKGA